MAGDRFFQRKKPKGLKVEGGTDMAKGKGVCSGDLPPSKKIRARGKS